MSKLGTVPLGEPLPPPKIVWQGKCWRVQRNAWDKVGNWKIVHCATNKLAVDLFYKADAIAVAKLLPEISDDPANLELEPIRDLFRVLQISQFGRSGQHPNFEALKKP